MDLHDILEDAGFSKSESLVYLCLLRLGQSKSGAIIQQTGLQSSVVHNALNTLAEKGLISYVFLGKVKRYASLDPKIILKSIDAKKEQFMKALPALESLALERNNNMAFSEVYIGYTGLMSATLTMLEGCTKGDCYKFFSAEHKLLSKESLQFFKKTDEIKRESGLVVRGIAEFDARASLGAYSQAEIRFTKQKIPPAMNIYKNNLLIFSLSNKPTAILIQSQEISRQYHLIWDHLWAESNSRKK